MKPENILDSEEERKKLPFDFLLDWNTGVLLLVVSMIGSFIFILTGFEAHISIRLVIDDLLIQTFLSAIMILLYNLSRKYTKKIHWLVLILFILLNLLLGYGTHLIMV